METRNAAIYDGLDSALVISHRIIAEFWPHATSGFGAAFGAVTPLALDEAAVSALALGDPPWKTPLAPPAYGIISHLFFGLVAERARRSLRAAL